MKTVKLYDKSAYLAGFSATVLSCVPAEGGFALLLDKTAFFPEEGGQPCDMGTIENAAVLYVNETEGVITHIVDKPFKVGETVNGKIDFNRRFDFMQNHSGEHIVSGIIKKKYGFDNVSFHLNENLATVDFNGILTREMLNEVELAAARAVFENREITAYYPTGKELETLNYRSKKEINGDIRIVDIKGVDICACCAPHVSRTGEIGLIKLLDTTKMRGGTRVVLKCGRYALLDYENKAENISCISEMLSAKQETAAEAVVNLIKKSDYIKQQNNEYVKRLIASIVKTSSEIRTFYEKDFDIKQLQMLTDGLHKTYGGVRAAFSGENDNLNFAICGGEAELKSVFTEFRSAFNVRGGGRGEMVQGSVLAPLEEVIRFFNERIS